ncbi:MAG: hypothetical protein QME87_10290 [Bacillota bacterium]|nr:hypothetical protein [Bacillota bacterium]
MREPFRINTPQGVRIIGHLANMGGRLVLVKRVERAKHFHTVLQAWGTDKAALRELHRRGAWGIRLEVDDGSVLEAPLERILALGIERDFRFGAQVFLRESSWDVVRGKPGSATQLTFSFTAGAGEAV